MRNYRNIIIALIVISVGACTQHSKSFVADSAQQITPDCTGSTSELMIPAGLSGANAKLLAGKPFAKLVAVDKMDGGMQIKIEPPDSNGFPVGLIDDYSDRTIRIIACREDKSFNSLLGGILAPTACSKLGSINIVGQEGVMSSDFTTAYTTGGKIIHDTNNPTFDSQNNLLKPDFIMITVDTLGTDSIGRFMLAFGKSPYYSSGCYKD